MLETKLFEVRDRGTTLPCIGIACEGGRPAFAPENRDLVILRRAGYGPDRCILFGRLEGGEFRFNPYDHSQAARTVPIAHNYVAEHWDELESGAIVDVEFILGETTQPKTTDLP